MMFSGLLSIALFEPVWAEDRNLIRESAPPGEERVALVIGNSRYQHVPQLQGATEDARLIASTLEDLDFTVTIKLDQSQNELERAIADFQLALSSGSVGFFYYSGHGIQVDGENYLIPIDAKLENPAYIKSEAINLSEVMVAMDRSESRMNIVVLDACRTNPFAGQWTTSGRSLSAPGLAQVDTPDGFVLAYSTAPNDVAADLAAGARNGPYALALAENLKSPGKELIEVFRGVRDSVKSQTSGDQEPWLNLSIGSQPFYLSSAPDSLELGPLKVAVREGGRLTVNGKGDKSL